MAVTHRCVQQRFNGTACRWSLEGQFNALKCAVAANQLRLKTIESRQAVFIFLSAQWRVTRGNGGVHAEGIVDQIIVEHETVADQALVARMQLENFPRILTAHRQQPDNTNMLDLHRQAGMQANIRISALSLGHLEQRV